MKCLSTECRTSKRERPENDRAPLGKEKPTAFKKSAADVIDGYYKRRYIMFKEMYERGNIAR